MRAPNAPWEIMLLINQPTTGSAAASRCYLEATRPSSVLTTADESQERKRGLRALLRVENQMMSTIIRSSAPSMVCITPVAHIMDKQVVKGQRRRRAHSSAFKRELVARSLEPGASGAAVAMDSGINANLLFG